MKRRLSLTIAFFLICNIVSLADNYRLLRGERLTNNQVNCITQDVRGFIWLGTDNGLNRYDGQNVTQYHRIYGDTAALGGNTVRCITPCADGSLWVGLANGMQRFCPRDDNFHTIQFPRGITPNVTRILNLRSGDVVIGSSGYGLFFMKDDKRYQATNWDKVNDCVPCRYITSLLEDGQGRLWIGSNENGCWIYDLKTGKSWRATPDDVKVGEPTFIGEDASGRVTLVTHTNIYMCGRTERVCHDEYCIDGGRDIVSASHDAEGHLMLVVRHEGLMTYNRQQHTITPYRPVSPSTERLMRTLHHAMVDRSGNLWLASNTLGVAMMPASGQPFSHWGREDYDVALDGQPFAIWADDNSNVNVCYETGAIATFDSEGNCLAQRVMPTPVRGVCRAADGRVWLGHFYGGLSYLDERGVQHVVDTDQGRCINTLDEDADGMLWYAPFGHGFCRLNPATGEVTRYEMSDSALHLGNNWVNSLAVDGKGRVWLGHCGGVSCFDPAVGHCLSLPEVEALPFTFGYCLEVSRDGTVWVGTDNGLIQIAPDLRTVSHITTAQGLSNDNISSIEEDAEGRIWVSTMDGLNRISLDDGIHINRYYAGAGLVDKQYYRAASAYDAATGRLFFGGTRGVTSFSPQRLDSRRDVPDVRLMALIVNNLPASARTMSGGHQVMTVAVTEADEFRLGYEDNSFTMEFGVTNFGSTDDIAYEYSFDEVHWNRTPPGQNRITFTHLNSGTYPLHVRALLGSGVSDVKRYVIHISAPWYATVWAWLAYTLLFLLLVAAGVFVYLRNKEAELKENKLVFFTNISHEIRTPMTMIVSPLDKLVKDTTLSADVHRSLVVMRQNAGRILMLMNQLLDIRKFDKGQMTLSCRRTDVVGFLDGLAHLFDEQARARGITFTYERPDTPVEAWIDQNHIDKVTMNLLGNAFKFTPDGGTVTMRLTKSDTSFTVSVTDTGIGLDPKDKDRIFQRFYRSAGADGRLGTGIGLHLSAELMRLHHGELTGDNRSDGQRGSIFSFTLPLGSDYLSADEIATTAAGSDETPSLVQHEIEMPEVLTPSADDAAVVPDTEAAPAVASPKMAKGGVRVMIVDDDEEILSYLKNELQGHYRLILCRDGQEAITMALREQPAVIVSDVMMPVMDGCTMVKRLRSNANISHIPVILLSAKTEVEDRVAGLSQGADAYLAKPFHTDELLAMIQALIEGRQRLRGVYSGARDQDERVEDIEMQSSDEQLMDRLMKVVNQHLSDSDFNIEQLASEVGLSRTHLHRKLKAMTGLSASEFLRNLRMRQAEQLLKNKRMNISQIAYAVGFANQTHFSTAFKKYSGLSPSEYIEAHSPKP